VILYDAARCPYCARVRIALAEKGVGYETHEIDLAARPGWLYTKNPSGRVPVLEEDAFVLPESVVIMEYLEERFPEPALWPADAGERALARLWLDRFDVRLGDDYYARRRGEASLLEERLGALDAVLEGQPFLTGRDYGLADIGYLPWILRARSNLGVELDGYQALSAWLERLSERPAVEAELGLLATL
jgi:glutathione S-transferase